MAVKSHDQVLITCTFFVSVLQARSKCMFPMRCNVLLEPFLPGSGQPDRPCKRAVCSVQGLPEEEKCFALLFNQGTQTSECCGLLWQSTKSLRAAPNLHRHLHKCFLLRFFICIFNQQWDTTRVYPRCFCFFFLKFETLRNVLGMLVWFYIADILSTTHTSCFERNKAVHSTSAHPPLRTNLLWYCSALEKIPLGMPRGDLQCFFDV